MADDVEVSWDELDELIARVRAGVVARLDGVTDWDAVLANIRERADGPVSR
jgi:hypothetical protein